MEAESLSAACELAFSVAREGVEATPPVDPPTPMRSFLYVAQLPKRAITVAQRVIDEDAVFRATVAQAATVEAVGEVGHLWLTRPDGWEAMVDLIESADAADGEASSSGEDSSSDEDGTEAEAPASNGADTPPPPPPPSYVAPQTSGSIVPPAPPSEMTSRDEIQEELTSLQGLVTRLSEERRSVSSEVETVQSASADGGISIQIESLRKDLADIRAERDRSQEQREMSIVRQAELADEIVELRSLIGRLEEERAGIQATLAQAEEQVAGVQIVVTDLEGQRDSVVAERNELTTERDELTLKRDELLAQTDSLSGERETLTAEVAELSSQRDSLTHERNNLIGERDDLNSQLVQAGSNAEELEAQIHDISGQAASLQGQFETLSGERAAVGAELQRINSDLSTTTEARRSMVDSLSSQLSELKGERDVLANNLEQSQQSLAALRGAFSAATESLSSELEKVDASSAEVSSTHESLTAAIEATGSKLDTLSNAPEPAAPNLAVLDSALPEGAGVVDFTADIPAPPTPLFTAEDALTGPAYKAPAAPTLLAEDLDSDDDGDSEMDELDAVSEEVAAELGDDAATAVEEVEAEETSAELPLAGRRTIEIPDSIKRGSKDESRHVVNTPDVIVLIQGDPVASKGWPEMSVSEQRGALVTYLNILAGDAGAAPDVMFDSAVGDADNLPESRVVRIRLSTEEGSDSDELAALISSYPEEWPVAVVTDDDVLAAAATAANATALDTDQLLDLFMTDY